jgi:hypothetical protein
LFGRAWVGGRARRYSTTAVDSALGLLLLALYVTGMVSLAAGVTYVAIRIFPTKDRPGKKPDDAPPSDDGTGAGRLFRKAKRAATG